MTTFGTLAYLGPEGTYSEEAALHVAARQRRPARSIKAVFDAVASGGADAGVVPGENVLEGAVNETLDQLLRADLRIIGEVVLPIRHCLLGRPGRPIERVYSHPQALAQCAAWLEQHLPGAARVDCSSTAEAAAVAAGDPAGAAIAGAPRSGLEILERDLGLSGNRTRFFVIARTAALPTGNDRSLIAFRTQHRSGALHACLGPFAAAGINLYRLEHRPSPSSEWTYHFFAEIEGHPTSPRVERALDELRGCATEVRVLGAWPAGAR